MNCEGVKDHIVSWLAAYAGAAGSRGFAIGISGGVDSAVTSVLCAETGLDVLCINMPIRQSQPERSRSEEHIKWLRGRYKNVQEEFVDLTPVFDGFEKALPERAVTFLSMANSRARLRMTTLYAFAGACDLLVAGTGNKIEDFGIGFFDRRRVTGRHELRLSVLGGRVEPDAGRGQRRSPELAGDARPRTRLGAAP